MSPLLSGAIGALLACSVMILILWRYLLDIFDQHTRLLMRITQLELENLDLRCALEQASRTTIVSIRIANNKQ